MLLSTGLFYKNVSDDYLENKLVNCLYYQYMCGVFNSEDNDMVLIHQLRELESFLEYTLQCTTHIFSRTIHCNAPFWW